MINLPAYNLTGGGRRIGIRATDGPKGSLLSTFRNTTDGLEAQETNKKMGAFDQSNGAAARSGSLTNFESDEDENGLASPRALSVAASSQDTRTRLPNPSRGAKARDGSDDGYHDVDDFLTPKQSYTKSSQGSLSDDDTAPGDKQRKGDIKPTIWKSSKSQTSVAGIKGKEEHDKETQMLLRERAEGRVNPQHIRGAGFVTEGVVKSAKKPSPGISWDTGQNRKKNTTYKSKATFGGWNRKSTQTKPSLDTDSEDENKKESKSESLSSSSAQCIGGFRDPTKLYAIPPKEIEKDNSANIVAFSGGFRDPPKLPSKRGCRTKGDETEDDSTQSIPFAFKDPTELYKLPKKKTPEPKEPKTKPLINPFDIKHNNESEGEESQIRINNDSSDDASSFKGRLDKGDSKKRKASKAINLTFEGGQPGKDDGFSSLNDAEFPIRESQSSSQAKKRKAATRNPDICVICDEVLPDGTLDAWRYADGELKPLKMADWTAICSRHKESKFQKQWIDAGYPVINWGELKNRVERHHQTLVGITTNKIASPFRDVLMAQNKETRGNAAMLLRKDIRLVYPGYYGPRGSSILLHEITARFGSFIGNAAKKDSLIGKGGVSAFIQTVLVPELGVRLIMEDMGVGEPAARKILGESQDLGEKLHYQDNMEDIYDENDGPWFDINAPPETRQMAPKTERKPGRLVDIFDSD